MDSIGAFLATVLAAFVPIVFGFTAYLVVAAALFVATFGVVRRIADAEHRLAGTADRHVASASRPG